MSGMNDMNVGNQYTDAFHRQLRKLGIDFATGVPCGVLRPFINNFRDDPGVMHVPALNEREAVGLAAGAYLGGKRPALYMQNSGLFVASNEFASILCYMGIPALAIISHRGCAGEDAGQHKLTGENTKLLLDGFGIFRVDLMERGVEELPLATMAYTYSTRPSAILVRRGWTKLEERARPAGNGDVSIAKLLRGEVHHYTTSSLVMDRERAIDEVLLRFGQTNGERDHAIFSTTGLISRYIYEKYDDVNMMYNPGGFGQTSAMACGFSLARPDVLTCVIDGDGSLLTDVGNLLVIGTREPKNLTHIVIDNGAYGSCSEEASLAGSVKYWKIAARAGYRNVYLVDNHEALLYSVGECMNGAGPNMIVVKIALGGRRDYKRPTDMAAIAQRFRNHFATSI